MLKGLWGLVRPPGRGGRETHLLVLPSVLWSGPWDVAYVQSSCAVT